MRQIEAKDIASVRRQLVERQGNRCALCGLPFTKADGPVVDHDHGTGVIRGALHRSCNMAEGKVRVKAYKGHKGVTPYAYLIGLGKYLDYHKTARVALIHPSHMTAEQKRLEKNEKARIKRRAVKRLKG